MTSNYYTMTVDFLGRHKTKIANVIYYPDKKVEYPVGFMYEFMPREKTGQYTVDSLGNIFDSLIKNALFAGITEDEKRSQIATAFALYNASNPIFKAPPANDADVKKYVRKDCEITTEAIKNMVNMVFAEPETSAPAFTARKVGIMHYFPDAKKIIFNGPATIVLWANGTKTVVKCMDGDAYDPEKAVLMAYLEKILGGKGPAKRFLKDCLKDYTPQADIETISEKAHFENAYDLDYSDVLHFKTARQISMLDNREKVQIIRSVLGTMPAAEAAKALGISETTVRRIRKEKKEC